MTALANTIEAPMQVLGLSRNEATDRARELLSMLGLADKCNHFARALATRPKVMPFDEVTSALDRDLCREEHNLTMLTVTHQMVFCA
jgi:polar amino acid transport system ATP-binding protein